MRQADSCTGCLEALWVGSGVLSGLQAPEEPFHETGLVSPVHSSSNSEEEIFWIYMNSPAVDVSKWSHPWQQNSIPSPGWRNFYLPLIDWLFCFPFWVWILVFLPLNKAALNYSLMDSSWCCCDVCSSEWQNQGCTQVAKTWRQNPSICRRKIMNLCKFTVYLNPIFNENAANRGLHTRVTFHLLVGG